MQFLKIKKTSSKKVPISLQTYEKHGIRQKIDVNITADVWKKGGVHTFANCPGSREKQIIIIFVKKALVLKVGTLSRVPTDTDSHEER